MLGTFLPYITNISCLCIRFHPKTPKYNVFAVKTQGIFKNSMETQGFFENSRPKQPSKLQKLKISETPLTNGAEKTPKKIPALGSWGPMGLKFVREIGGRIAEATGEKRSRYYLLQAISMAIQRGNVSSILGTAQNGKKLEEIYYL